MTRTVHEIVRDAIFQANMKTRLASIDLHDFEAHHVIDALRREGLLLTKDETMRILEAENRDLRARLEVYERGES